MTNPATAHHQHLIRSARKGDRWNPESYRLPPCHGQTVRALQRRGLVWVDQYGPDSRDRMVYLTEDGESLRMDLRAHDLEQLHVSLVDAQQRRSTARQLIVRTWAEDER